MAARRRLEEMEATMPDELRHLTTLTRRELDSPPAAAPARRTPSPIGAPARSSSMSDRVAERMFSELDSDGDGVITMEEMQKGFVPRVFQSPAPPSQVSDLSGRVSARLDDFSGSVGTPVSSVQPAAPESGASAPGTSQPAAPEGGSEALVRRVRALLNSSLLARGEEAGIVRQEAIRSALAEAGESVSLAAARYERSLREELSPTRATPVRPQTPSSAFPLRRLRF